MKLPQEGALVAAGSFGLAIALPGDTRTTVRRVPWSTVDRTLPAHPWAFPLFGRGRVLP